MSGTGAPAVGSISCDQSLAEASPRKAEKEEGMRTRLVPVCFVLAILATPVPALRAADTPVQRVIVVQTDDVAGYLKELETARAITKRLQGSGVIRAWRARFAGLDAGAIVVSIEYPSLIVMARDEEKAQADPEERALLARLAKMRKIVSDSLYDELKP